MYIVIQKSTAMKQFFRLRSMSQNPSDKLFVSYIMNHFDGAEYPQTN